MKDVLFLCQFFYPEYISSATLPFDTAKALVDAGFSVDVITGYPHEYSLVDNVAKNEIIDGIGIHRLKYLQLSRNNFFGRLVNYFSFTCVTFFRLMKIRDYRILMVYSNPPILPLIAIFANYFFGIKIIFVSYDVYPEIAQKTKTISEDGIISRFMNYVNKKLFNRLEAVVAMSTEMKDFLVENRANLSNEKVIVIPNWYEDSLSRNEKQFMSNRNILTVSYFGNMGVCQDLDTILDAIRLLQSDTAIRFVFAGHGNKFNLLTQTVKEEKLEHVSVYGFLHGDDYLKALSESDVCLVSLVEGVSGLAVPSKTYAYMMSGKPVIAIIEKTTDIAHDLISNEAGYVINSGDAKSLAQRICFLKENFQIRENMSSNVRKVYLKNYSKDVCLEKYVRLISATIGLK